MKKASSDNTPERNTSQNTNEDDQALEGVVMDELPQENEVVEESTSDTSELDAKEAELQAQKDKYLRLAAEYDNYRKRTARELLQASTRGQADLLKGLLDSLDDLARFSKMEVPTEETKSFVDGVALIERNIMKALTNYGVVVIDPVGEPFDPNLHEALSSEPTESEEKDNTVSQVYQRGYRLNDHLIRPARVVVNQYQ